MSGDLRSHETLTTARRSARRVATPLRPLWEAYVKAWKEVSDAMDDDDRAMLAENAGKIPRRTSPASIKAEKRLEEAKKTFDAISEAFAAAPARTADDAVCKLLFVIDVIETSGCPEAEEAARAAIRVLRKVTIHA